MPEVSLEVEECVDVVELQKENADLKEQIQRLKHELEALRSVERELIAAVNQSDDALASADEVKSEK